MHTVLQAHKDWMNSFEKEAVTYISTLSSKSGSSVRFCVCCCLLTLMVIKFLSHRICLVCFSFSRCVCVCVFLAGCFLLESLHFV